MLKDLSLQYRDPAQTASTPDKVSAAQGRLCQNSVLVVGAGGLGSPAVLYLAAAGIGKLGIVDKDTVELSNLHRQIVHSEAGQGCHKAESATAACRALNSSIQASFSIVKHAVEYSVKAFCHPISYYALASRCSQG